MSEIFKQLCQACDGQCHHDYYETLKYSARHKKWLCRYCRDNIDQPAPTSDELAAMEAANDEERRLYGSSL